MLRIIRDTVLSRTVYRQTSCNCFG